MELWHKMIFPVRRVWIAVATRVKSRKNGGGLLKLHNDVQTCEYQDVQVMWEMLRRSESELMGTTTTTTTTGSVGNGGGGQNQTNPTKRKQRPFWRVFVLSHHNTTNSPPSPSPSSPSIKP